MDGYINNLVSGAINNFRIGFLDENLQLVNIPNIK